MRVSGFWMGVAALAVAACSPPSTQEAKPKEDPVIVPYKPPAAKSSLAALQGVSGVHQLDGSNVSLDFVDDGTLGSSAVPLNLARSVQELSQTIKANDGVATAPVVTYMVSMTEGGGPVPMFDIAYRVSDLKIGDWNELEADEVLDKSKSVNFVSTRGKEAMDLWCREAPKAPKFCAAARKPG